MPTDQSQADEKPEEKTSEDVKQTDAAKLEATQVAELPEWAQKHIRELRSENAGYRATKAQIEADAAAAREAALKENGKWQDLYAEAEPKIKRVEILEATVAALLDAELEALPDPVKAVVPDFDDPVKRLEWVRKAKSVGLASKPAKPRTDAQEQVMKPAELAQTEEQKREFAAIFGLNPKYL